MTFSVMPSDASQLGSSCATTLVAATVSVVASLESGLGSCAEELVTVVAMSMQSQRRGAGLETNEAQFGRR